MVYPSDAPGLEGMGGFWDDLVSAGSLITQNAVGQAQTALDKELAELKATLATTALLSAIGAACGVALLLKGRL